MGMQVIKDLLSDDLYDSKDWRDADTAERVEYLIELVAYKNREIDLWLEQIEQLQSRVRELAVALDFESNYEGHKALARRELRGEE